MSIPIPVPELIMTVLIAIPMSFPWKQEIRSIERVCARSAHAVTSYIPFLKYLTCNFSDLDLVRFKVIIVPIESLLVVSYLTSFESNIVSHHFRDI